MANTAQEQQRLNAELARIEAQIEKESKERTAIRRQLRSLDLTEGERNALEAQSLELENSIEGLYRSQTARNSELKVLTNDVPKSSNPPVAALGNQPVPPASNQNTGGNATRGAGSRYQQAIANDQVKLDNLNNNLAKSNQDLAALEARRAELTKIINSNPEGSPAYEAAAAERRGLASKRAELETQQIGLRQDIQVRENSLATNANQLSLLTTQAGAPTIPPPPPDMATDTTGTNSRPPSETGAQLPIITSTPVPQTIGTAPLDDPEAGEYEARQFLLDQQPVESFAPPPVSDDNLAFEPTFDDGAAFAAPTPPRDDPNAGEFEAQQFVTGSQLRAAPQPVTVIDPETGLPVETLESVQARQDFAAQETGVSPYGEEDDPQELPADTDTTVEDTEGYIVPDGTINVPPDGQLLRQPTALGGDYSAQFDPETQSWGIYDNETGEFIQTGIADEAEAIVLAQEYSIGDPNFAGNADAAGADPGLTPEQQQQQAAAQAAAEEQARQQALLAQLRQQATIQEQRKQANEGDWRVKLRLAESAQYLFLDPEIQQGSILWPLLETGGVIFPYTPTITTSYNANYNNYDLTHSNYRGYFYQNSYVGEVNIQATFTAQDTKEAEYLLAVIHFFRSVTKMFYGQQDAFRGSPPPMVFLQGLGEFQFNLHPCLVQSFNYNLPSDVDYIRARSPNITGTNLQIKRQRDILPTSPFSASSARMSAAGVNKGAEMFSPAPPTLGTKSPTYVPTKIDMTIVLLPVQSRQQVSKGFSMKQFANGDLIKKGFW